MTTKRGPRHKISRRFGMDIYGTGGPSLERRIGIPPGGLRAKKGRPSDYGVRLIEKQKVRLTYGVSEKQFLRYFEMAKNTKEPTGRVLLELLERRLDNVVYRLGFARTRPMARQIVSHGHVRVDGERVTIPSFLVKPGQKIALSPTGLRIPEVQAEMEWRKPTVSWLQREDGAGSMTAMPNRDELDPGINESLIVEYYAR